LFSWVFGAERGWEEINRGADIRISVIFKYLIKYVTPVILILVFVGALVSPDANDWPEAFRSLFSGNGWPLDNGSIIRQITGADIKQQIAMAVIPEEKEALQHKYRLITGTKLLLLAVFCGISYLVYIASQRRKLEGREY